MTDVIQEGEKTMVKNGHYAVDLYENGRWTSEVGFKYKWQALLFHLILNRSHEHAGVRKY